MDASEEVERRNNDLSAELNNEKQAIIYDEHWTCTWYLTFSAFPLMSAQCDIAFVDSVLLFSFLARLKLLFCPIRRWNTVRKDNGNVETQIELFPEAFRMCFYLYFFVFLIIATVTTTQFAETDFNDNPVINTFGWNNECVMFDDPPFSYVSATLWWPATILLLSFEVHDYIRVYDHYHYREHSHPISKSFLVYYSISTALECVAVICFAQVFATSPTESIYLHTWPYIFLLQIFWLLILKRFLYLRKLNMVSWHGVLYLGVCAISTIIKVGLYIPNLYGARVWETYPWTKTMNQINDPIYLLITGGGPMLIYGFIGVQLDTVVLTMTRATPKGLGRDEIEMMYTE